MLAVWTTEQYFIWTQIQDAELEKLSMRRKLYPAEDSRTKQGIGNATIAKRRTKAGGKTYQKNVFELPTHSQDKLSDFFIAVLNFSINI